MDKIIEYMKRYFVLGAVLFLAACSAKESPKEIVSRVYDLAAGQVTLMDSELGPEECPRTIDAEGRLVKTDIGWWCSGFFPGTLWAVYEQTGNEAIREMAERRTRQLEGLAFRKTDHDIGFQIFSSFGNALRVTENPYYLTMLELAGRRLAERFNPKVGCLRSWGDDSEPTFRVIIDNMMNLEILVALSHFDSNYDVLEIAESHADFTMKNHFREDMSTWHLVEYDAENGDVIRKKTVQGYSDDSMWARGQAWALYGYTMMFRVDEESRYLQQAEKIASLLLKKLPSDGIPYWDFDCPDIPDTYKDASAAAIMSSAFLQLYLLTGKKEYFDIADKQIRTLASPEYLSEPGENHGFLLKHCVGNLPANSEVDVPLTYADYYFLEALRLYKKF